MLKSSWWNWKFVMGKTSEKMSARKICTITVLNLGYPIQVKIWQYPKQLFWKMRDFAKIFSSFYTGLLIQWKHLRGFCCSLEARVGNQTILQFLIPATTKYPHKVENVLTHWIFFQLVLTYDLGIWVIWLPLILSNHLVTKQTVKPVFVYDNTKDSFQVRARGRTLTNEKFAT